MSKKKNNKLDWDKLLNTNRERESTSGNPSKFRNEFDKDYQRIIYSSSLRRLQDKAQVFPLQENDFPRTRLTHSLEVASPGESLAWNVGYQLREKGEFDSVWQIKEFTSMVETACLVHDLGNPPFGHYGEDIIGKWFKTWFKSKEFKNIEKQFIEKGHNPMSTQQKNDFIFFDGNAQSVRILSKLQFLNDQYGVNFTYGTLATMMKYPWSSSNPKTIRNGKFGYFYSEADLFEKISESVEIGDHRHPATYLLEAADDIAYLTADLEDGVKKGYVKWSSVSEELENWLELNEESSYYALKKSKEKTIRNRVPSKELVNVQNFKVIAQGILFNSVVEEFIGKYELIMNGEYNGSLLDNKNVKEFVEMLEAVSIKHCYSNEEVITLELVGDRVISDLLEEFVGAVSEVDFTPNTKVRSGKLFSLISDNFTYIQSLDNTGQPNIKFENQSLYYRLQLVTDFISGMTDSYAVTLHQKLMGVRLP